MILALQDTDWYKQLSHPDNKASSYLKDYRLNRDVWDINQDLPFLAEEAHIIGNITINFQKISLLWLKDLTKLAVIMKVSVRRWGLSRVISLLSAVKNFNSWLVENCYVMPSALTTQVVQQWGMGQTDVLKQAIQQLFKVFRELNCTNFQIKWQQHNKNKKRRQPIPEEVKYQIDLGLMQLDKPVYLVFKLQESLGTRSKELPRIPLDCLRIREGVARIKIPTGKQGNSIREQDLPEKLINLVQKQQVFIREKFGTDFPWLFANWTERVTGAINQKFSPVFEYHPEQIKRINIKLNNILKRLIKYNNICTCDGSLCHVTSHQFRHTYATVANRMGKRPEQIQHGLRHVNLDMQDAYVEVTPQEQEKNIQRILVNKDGQQVIYKTDRDREVIRREWQVRQIELGLCGRPNIFKDCQYEHICLGCEYAYYSSEDISRLLP